MTDDHPRTRHLHVVVSSVCRRDLLAQDRRECLALEQPHSNLRATGAEPELLQPHTRAHVRKRTPTKFI